MSMITECVCGKIECLITPISDSCLGPCSYNSILYPYKHRRVTSLYYMNTSCVEINSIFNLRNYQNVSYAYTLLTPHVTAKKKNNKNAFRAEYMSWVNRVERADTTVKTFKIVLSQSHASSRSNALLAVPNVASSCYKRNTRIFPNEFRFRRKKSHRCYL